MTRPRVIFVNRFYWPEEPATAQLLTDLATALAARGHEVVVVTSRPPANSVPLRELRNGVAIERVRTTRWGRRSLAGRACDFATFYPAALWRLLRLARRTDVIVALTDPPLIGVIAGLAAWLRGAALVHWVQDIYPEIAIQVTGHRWPAIFRPLRNVAWRRAARCVVPGADMAETLLASVLPPARVVVSPNWAPAGVAPPSDTDVAALRRSWGLDDKFVAAYSGNLGRVHDLAPLLDVAAALRARPEFVFLFVGHGAQRDALEHAARARGLTNIHFRPPQPRENLAAALGVGDVHFVTLLPGAERSVFPSKLYGIARIGRPVIFIGAAASEFATQLRSHGFGAAFTRDDTQAIAAFLLKLRDEPAPRAALCAHARAFGANGFAEVVAVWDRLMRDELAARSGSL